jgi:DUF1680 family protein
VKPVRQKWFGCACCPPNISRLVESVQEYAYTLSDDGDTLFTHLYMGGSANFKVGGVPVRLDMASELPWKGSGEATIRMPSGAAASQAGSIDATLAFRLPGWAGGEDAADAISASGERDGGRIVREVRHGYVYFIGAWRDGDVVTFDFPMPVNMLAANPRVREDAGKVAFVRGPVTYCAEERDNGANLHLLHIDTDAIVENPDAVSAVGFDFHAGAEGMNDAGLGEVDAVTRHMVRLEVPAWREDGPAAADAVDAVMGRVNQEGVASDDNGDTPVDAHGSHDDCGAPADPRGSRDEMASAGGMPLYMPYKPARRTPVTAMLIPYFAWANRGENEMTVWLNH